MKTLSRFCVMVFFVGLGLVCMAAMLVAVSAPTSHSQELVNKYNNQKKRLATQPAISNSKSLAQLCDDK